MFAQRPPHVGMWRTSKTMLRATCCCLLLALAALGQATAQRIKDDSQQTKLLVMEHLWNEAQVNRDARALDAMIGGEFVNTEYDGEVMSVYQMEMTTVEPAPT